VRPPAHRQIRAAPGIRMTWSACHRSSSPRPWSSRRTGGYVRASTMDAVTLGNRAGRHRAAWHGRRWADPAGRRQIRSMIFCALSLSRNLQARCAALISMVNQIMPWVTHACVSGGSGKPSQRHARSSLARKSSNSLQSNAQQRTRHGDEYPIAPRLLLPGGTPHDEAQVSIDAHDRLLAEAHRPVPALKVAPRRRAAQKPGGRRVPAMPIAAELVNVQAAVMSYAFTQLRSRRLLPE
jgi:hypothetical protein